MKPTYSPMTYFILGMLALLTLAVVTICSGLWLTVLWQRGGQLSESAVLILPTPDITENERPESPLLEATAMSLPNPPTAAPFADEATPAPQSSSSGDSDSTALTEIPDLEILSQKTYIDARGRHHIVGEVRNNSQFTAKYVEIVAKYYDEDNKLQGANLTFTDPNSIGAGEIMPFDLVILRRVHWANNHSYELSVKGYPTDELVQQNVILISQASRLDKGFLYVTGEVKNIGADWMLVKVVVTLYDADNQVINSKWDYIKKAMLAPNAQAPFEVKLEHQTSPDDYHFRVQIEETKTSSPGVVDNTPTPTNP